MALNEEFYFSYTEYQEVIRLIYQKTYGITNTKEIYNKERKWLWSEVAKRSAVADVEKDNNGKVIRFKYSSQYYLKEVLEVKIGRFLQEAKKEKDGSERAKILEQMAVQHAMRLFLLMEPRPETTKTGGKLYYEFFRSSDVRNLDEVGFASYQEFETWLKKQVFYNEEAISELLLNAYFNSYTNYVRAAPDNQDFLSSLPDDLILTAVNFLTKSEEAALPTLNRYYLELFNNLRNVSELRRKPKTKKELDTILVNRFDVYQNLVSLDLLNVPLDNAELPDVLKKIQAFEKLKKLRLKVANQAQLTQLISVLDWSSNTSDFLNNIQLEISGIKQDWINFKNTKALLQKRSNLSLWFETLDTSFFGNANIKAITIPKGMHVSGDLWLHNNPELSSVTIPENMHVGGDLRLDRNRKLESVIFLKNMHVGGDLWLNNNRKLESVIFPENMRVGRDLYLYNNRKLESVTIPENMHVGRDLWLNSNRELKSVTIPKSMHVGGKLRLDDNPELESVTIPKGVHVGGGLYLSNNPKLSSVTFPENMCVGGDLLLYGNPELKSVIFPKGMHVKGNIRLEENDSLSSVTFPENMYVGAWLYLQNNPELKSVIFPENMRVGGDLYLYNNPELSSITFEENMHVGGELHLYRNNNLSSVKIGRGVTIKRAKLTGCAPEVLKTFFHDLRGVERFELSKDTKIVGSGLFIVLLLNKELNKDSIVYRDDNWDTKSLCGNEWFTLRDKLLDTGGSKEKAFANLEKSEKQMLLQVQGDLQAYLDSHHPDTENAGSLDNNNDKKNLNDNSNKHTQNKETTEAPAQDYNLIKQIVEGLEKLRDPGSYLDSTITKSINGTNASR